MLTAEQEDRKLREWFGNQLYLPDFMRDFHDQKDLFKYLQHRNPNQKISWVDAQIYVIDIFLRTMAKHGYTLQRTRLRGISFTHIQDAITDFHIFRTEKEVSILESALKKATTP